MMTSLPEPPSTTRCMTPADSFDALMLSLPPRPIDSKVVFVQFGAGDRHLSREDR